MTQNTRNSDAISGRHQPEGLWSIATAATALGLLALTLLVLGALYTGVAIWLPQRPIRGAQQQWQMRSAGAGVQPNQAYDRRRWESQQRQWLDSYGWQDTDHQHARVPIQRAIEMISERNLQTGWSSADAAEGSLPAGEPESKGRDTTREAVDE